MEEEKVTDDRSSNELDELQRRIQELESVESELQSTVTALQESEEKFHTLFQTAPNAMITANEDGDIIFWNKAASEIYGYSTEKAVGKHLTFLMPERFHKAHLKTRNLISKGKSKPFTKIEVTGLKEDGSEFPIEISLATWKLGGERYYTEIIHDLTDRNEREKKLKAQNMEIKNLFEKETALRQQLIKAERFASMGQMAAKIAHEINNPLTVIMAQAQIKKSKTDDQELKDILDIISEKSKEVAELTRSYMDLGKQGDVKMNNILLGDVLKHTVESLTSLGQLKRVEISEEYMAHEPEIYGEAKKLEQVFRNLIINSIHATSGIGNGKIKVGIRSAEKGNCVEAYITDNGTGIESQDLAKIFEHYYTTKKDGVGTGLGLAISKEITEIIHGGKIEIESEPGVSTTFRVILPIFALTLEKKKVLVVDDEPSITTLFAKFLSTKGYLVRTSNKATEGLEMYESFGPDIVLCDVNMPEMSGFVLLERVREINPAQPFVMVTGSFLNPEEFKMLKEQKVPQIIKPPDLETELLTVVKQELEKNEQI